MPTKKMTTIVAVALISLSSTMLPRITETPSIDYEHLLQASYQKKRNFIDVVRDNTVASIVSTVGVVMAAVGIYKLVKTPKSDNTSTGTQKQSISAPLTQISQNGTPNAVDRINAVDTVRNSDTNHQEKGTPAERVTAAEVALQEKIKELENLLKQGMLDELLSDDVAMIQDAVNEIVNESIKVDANKLIIAAEKAELLCAKLRGNDTVVDSFANLKKRTIEAKAQAQQLKDQPISDEVSTHSSYTELEVAKKLADLDSLKSVATLEALIKSIAESLDGINKALALKKREEEPVRKTEQGQQTATDSPLKVAKKKRQPARSRAEIEKQGIKKKKRLIRTDSTSKVAKVVKTKTKPAKSRGEKKKQSASGIGLNAHSVTRSNAAETQGIKKRKLRFNRRKNDTTKTRSKKVVLLVGNTSENGSKKEEPKREDKKPFVA